MSNPTPDQIRAEIDATRADLSYDVDALTDKVTPSKIAHRQTEKVKSKLTSAKEAVMGVASDAKDSVTSGVSSGAGSLSDAPHKAAEKAKGNAVAVGLIAFGVGALIASLIPASEKEKAAASQIKEKAQPLVEQATDAAKEVASNLKEPAQDAAAAVKDTATEAAGSVKSAAGSAADDVKGKAKDAKDTVASS
ncbi:DUF3618 domain-containing protein [Naasia lichenicola]|uniref:DUF3618 domain-containing protein n=1 Tax=Naasia lichenicola TaxID=2565933 RepID=A0A4S4FIB9_9MICO|nr:DUF3618 domain-containing protein [Naasia lichenicola]THG29999.1 DUF3618 domain-containing protein [Naasia lichenicola]